MQRSVFALALILTTACAGGADVPDSSETDPTVDFGIIPPDVDSGWPEDSGYEGARSHEPDSGWRLRRRGDDRRTRGPDWRTHDTGAAEDLSEF